MNCLRVAGAALSAIRAVAISRGVIWAARPPQHVYGAPKQRAALEPWVALVSPFGRDAGDAESGLKHLQHGFDLHHGRLEPDAFSMRF
jgi:hypothetical protein